MLSIIAYLLPIRDLIEAAAQARYASHERAYFPDPSVRGQRRAEAAAKARYASYKCADFPDPLEMGQRRAGAVLGDKMREGLTYFVCSLGVLETWVFRRCLQLGQSTQSVEKARPLVGLTRPALTTSGMSAMIIS